MPPSRRESRIRRFFRKILPRRYKSSRPSRITIKHEENNPPSQWSNVRPKGARRAHARRPPPIIHQVVEESDFSCRQAPGSAQTEVHLPKDWEPLICRVDSAATPCYPPSIQAAVQSQHASDPLWHPSRQPFSIPRKPPPNAGHRVDPPRAKPFVPVRGWEDDWDKPLGLRLGPHKAVWKTPSFRLEIRNKRSIKKMEAEARIRAMEQVEATKVREALKMRSMRSVEEMAEEERWASREFCGIAERVEIAARNPQVTYRNFGSATRTHCRY